MSSISCFSASMASTNVFVSLSIASVDSKADNCSKRTLSFHSISVSAIILPEFLNLPPIADMMNPYLSLIMLYF